MLARRLGERGDPTWRVPLPSHLLSPAAQTAIIDEVLQSDAHNARALYYKAQIVLDAGSTDEAIGLLEQVASGTSDFAVPARTLLDDLRR